MKDDGSDGAVFDVNLVKRDAATGIILHLGAFRTGCNAMEFVPGAKIKMHVDQESR